jgi:hypothetical protein
MLPRFSKYVLSALLLFTALPANAVRPFQADGEEPLVHRPLVRSSGFIFAGTVQSVERIPAKRSNSVPVMKVVFRVEQAFRGVHAGQTFVVHEWAGLWQDGEHYRRGERVMLFLYPPSRLGLTSPVGGGAGQFRVDPQGNVVIEPRHLGRPGLGRRTVADSPIKLKPEGLFRRLRYSEGE